jgi:hypothetical protein
VGRPPNKQSGVGDHPSLWPDDQLPRSSPKLPEKNFKPLRFPLWTQNKARLIQEYLRLFEFITRHGTYIDGFAGPQASADADMWAAKLVLKTEPNFGYAIMTPAKLRNLKRSKLNMKRLAARSKRWQAILMKPSIKYLERGQSGKRLLPLHF